MKSEKEIFDDYCRNKNIYGIMKVKWEKDIKSTYGYQKHLFLTRMAETLDDMKSEIIKIIFRKK